MMTIQTTDCWAKEAESLEQAKRSGDEDLRHLYETIAKQWHLLAERTETRRAKAVGPADCANAPIVVDETGAFPAASDPTAAERLSAQTLYADCCTTQVLHDDRAELAGADAIEIMDEQTAETKGDVVHICADLDDNEALHDQIFEDDDRAPEANAAAALFESPRDQSLESVCSKALDQRMPETEAGCNTGQVIAASEGIDGTEDRLLGAGHSTLPASAEAEPAQTTNNEVSNNNRSAGNTGQTSRRIGSPLEWILSCWVGQSRK